MIISFVITTFLLAMLPGVGQALMMRQTLTAGPGVALATIGGTSTGLVAWSVAAGAGAAGIMLANPATYRLLLVAGGAFLVVIGGRTVWKAWHGADAHLTAETAPGGRRAAYLAGLATNLGNPKAGVFAVSLLPTFTASGGFYATVGLGMVWSAVTATWYVLFVLLVSRGRTLVTRPRVQQLVGCVSGTVLIIVGTFVALGA